MTLSNIKEVIKDASEGKIFILVDDENRENEGDLCILGEHATPEAVNFMAKYGRGLICCH
jgi:3,4-dihydroxy 2-butanone 4-phosphate synthase/GTP cyclohydrolase II